MHAPVHLQPIPATLQAELTQWGLNPYASGHDCHLLLSHHSCYGPPSLRGGTRPAVLGLKLHTPREVCQFEFLVSEQLSQPAGLRLLGFKRRSLVRDYHQIKHSYFIYPDEHSLAGSTAAFIALHQVLLFSDKVAICSHTHVAGAKPAVVALCPQQELVGSDDLQVRRGKGPEGGCCVHQGPAAAPDALGSTSMRAGPCGWLRRLLWRLQEEILWASVACKWGPPRVCRDAVGPLSHMWVLDSRCWVSAGQGAGWWHPASRTVC